MRVAWLVSGGRVLAVLSGEVDVAAEPLLRALEPAVAAQGLPVVVDASRVTWTARGCARSWSSAPAPRG